MNVKHFLLPCIFINCTTLVKYFSYVKKPITTIIYIWIMYTRNYYSFHENGIDKLNCLPNITKHNASNRSGQELPPLTANTGILFNRNLNYSYVTQPYILDKGDRTTTPLSDFFSESESDTPDFLSEESDSSAGSALCRSTAEATKILAQEWEKIERTLYNEDGEKCTRPLIIEECKQWKQLHPQLRVIGKSIPLPEKRLSCKQIDCDEVIAMHYCGYDQFSESEERLSQSSTDVTPQNSPRASSEDLYVPKSTREKTSFAANSEDSNFPDSFCSLLQISPLEMHRKQQVLRSEITSSKWVRGSKHDSIGNCDRNSAKSFASWDTRNYGNAFSASERKSFMNNIVGTAKQKDLKRQVPLSSPGFTEDGVLGTLSGTSYQYNVRKISLPPLHFDDKKKMVTTLGSAKKYCIKTKKGAKSFFQLDKMKNKSISNDQ